MKSWLHLSTAGLAEKVPEEFTDQMFAEMMAMFRSMLPGMSNELAEDIRKRCEVIRFKKRAVVLEYGQVCHHCFFAVQGLVTALFRRKRKEQTYWFMGEQDIVIAVESFYTQQPSAERLIALEDTDCIALHWDDLQFIYSKHVEFNRVGRLLTEFYYRQALERTKWVGLKAVERYELLFKEYPKFFGRVPDAAIASYLGINKATLSRIRGEVYKKK